MERRRSESAGRSRHRSGVWLLVAASPLLLLVVLPPVALLLRCPPAMIARYLGDSAVVQAIGLSVTTTAATVVLVVGFGTPLAYVLARRQFRGRALLEVMIDLPTVLPPAVAGVALLMAFGRNGMLGGTLNLLGIQLPFTPLAVVLAQAFVAAPYYVKSATVGLAAVSEELLDAAAIDGASRWQVFRFVTLPLAWHGIVGGAALCWSRALGEFGATIIFAGNYPGRTQTMPLAIYMGFQIDINAALTMAAILLGVSFAILLVVRAILRGN